MKSVLTQLKRIAIIVFTIIVLIVNVVIQSPKFLVTEKDYKSICQLTDYYKTAGLGVQVSRPYYSLIKLANDTAKYYFYTVNNPTRKDIGTFDALRSVAPYWGQYVFDNEKLKDISLSAQSMNNKAATSANQLLKLTDGELNWLETEILDVCYTLRFKDKSFYLILQLLGALSFVMLLYLFVAIARSKYDDYDDYDDYDNNDGDSEHQLVDADLIITAKLIEAEDNLLKSVRGLTANEQQYFTKL